LLTLNSIFTKYISGSNHPSTLLFQSDVQYRYYKGVGLQTDVIKPCNGFVFLLPRGFSLCPIGNCSIYNDWPLNGYNFDSVGSLTQNRRKDFSLSKVKQNQW